VKTKNSKKLAKRKRKIAKRLEKRQWELLRTSIMKLMDVIKESHVEALVLYI